MDLELAEKDMKLHGDGLRYMFLDILNTRSIKIFPLCETGSNCYT